MHQDCENIIKEEYLTKQEQDDILELTELNDFFADFIIRNYGEFKCSAFIWDCLICRAYFLKEALDSFIEEHIDAMERISSKQ